MIWQILLTGLPLVAHDGEGIGKFIPIIIFFIIFVINALGKILQGKSKKTDRQVQSKPKPIRPMPPQQQPSRPAPQPRIPIYARKMNLPDSQQPPQPTTVKPAPQIQRPVQATQQPRPAMPQPTARPRPPIPTRRISQPTRPVSPPPKPVKIQIMPQQPRRISQQKPIKKASQLPKQSVQKKPFTSAAQQAKRREKIRIDHQEAQYRAAKKQTVMPTAPLQAQPLDQLQASLNQPSELAKAIVYSEILGKPLAMRPPAAQIWD